MKCFLHEERVATENLNIPCSPTGKIPVCSECFDAPPGGELRRQLFEKYRESHGPRIERQRQLEKLRSN